MRHKTKWAVRVSTSKVIYFINREDAIAAVNEYGYAIYPPIYGD